MTKLRDLPPNTHPHTFSSLGFAGWMALSDLDDTDVWSSTQVFLHYTRPLDPHAPARNRILLVVWAADYIAVNESQSKIRTTDSFLFREKQRQHRS